jgi:iron complex outermembrane receptor protein
MWGAGINNRFYSHFRDQFPDGDGNVRWVGTYTLWDIYGSVKPIKNLDVLFGIKNLFNTSPPYTNAYQDNFASGYDALTADPLLRDFYVDLKYDFF